MLTVEGFIYPESDTKLKQVHRWVDDIDTIIKHVDKFDVCVQAGGAVGVWPARFAQHFKRVYTFEPVRENYECLMKNIPENVKPCPVALGDKDGTVKMVRDKFELGNAGAWYAKDGGDIPVIALDTMPLDHCDLIQLDVEGCELRALEGAALTIERFKPVIVIEEKPLPQQKNPKAARRFLQQFGYRVVGEIHRDIILKC